MCEDRERPRSHKGENQPCPTMHWGVVFAVADCDATVARARALGASVTNEPMDMPIGRFAGLIDPQGASFTIMQPAAGV
jgi:uncharacterized protein